MDEPLASLDEARRAEILPYIERLRDEAGVPIVYVSHSVAEVARLATTVVILGDGKVTAVGPVLDILPLAEASDGGSVLDAVVAGHDETFQLIAADLARRRAAGAEARRRRSAQRCAPTSARATSCCRCSRRRTSARSTCCPARSPAFPPSGAQADVRLDCNGAMLMARLTTKSVERLALAPGRPVHAVIKSVSFERS